MDFGFGCFLADAITSYHCIMKAEKIHAVDKKKTKDKNSLLHALIKRRSKFPCYSLHQYWYRNQSFDCSALFKDDTSYK